MKNISKLSILLIIAIIFISWNLFAIKNFSSVEKFCEKNFICEKFFLEEKNFFEKNNTGINWIDPKIWEINLEKINKILNLIERKWYESENLKDYKKLEDNILKWVVATLEDPYSSYMPAQQSKDFAEDMAWNFEWIWAELQMKDKMVVITSPLKWSPAINAWLLPQDIILKVDWEDILWQDLSKVVSKIRWPKWEEVVLTIFRKSDEKEFWETLDIKIIRDTIHINSVKYELKKSSKWESVWYISINQFWDKTIEEFYEWLWNAESDNVKYLVLDLRFNWWGYLDWAVWIASPFLEKWSIITTIKSKSWNRELKSIPFWKRFPNLPMAILINWGSASASEIVAWALRDYKKAILIWEKSFWKWSVQELVPFSDWSNLRITTAKWFTPNNQNIHEVWINPDVEIKRTFEDMVAKIDPQLEKAIEILENSDNWKKLNKFFDKKISLTWSVVLKFNWSWNLVVGLED